jgi:murein DD-endopeptidase MepM/ murein hydrolase activator NlpD
LRDREAERPLSELRRRARGEAAPAGGKAREISRFERAHSQAARLRRARRERRLRPATATLGFPLRGEWSALRTPADRVPSHGTDYFGQRFAFDFARLLGPRGKPYPASIWRHMLGWVRAAECHAWSEPVLAPFDGEIVEAGEGWRDYERLNLLVDLGRMFLFPPRPAAADYRPLAGNFILLEGDPGVALLAHLRCGTLRVRKGQTITEGEPLGLVGNSGNTTMPHLHFQLMDGRNPFEAQGLPCCFRRYEALRGETWHEVVDGVPNLLERIRVP